MATKIFTFSLKEETQEAAYAGNIGIQEALVLLQQLTIADTAQKLAAARIKADSEKKEATDEQPGKDEATTQPQ